MAPVQWMEPIPFGWTIQPDGIVQARMPQSALLLEDSFSQAGELTATVTVHRAADNPTYWKTVGIALWLHERNFWRLNLVEAPDNLNRQHSAELHEMYQGTWLAGNEPATRLTVRADLDYTRPGWVWEFGKPYRLRLVWDEKQISGEVLEADGTLCWRYGWTLDNPKAVRTGYLGVACNWFDATFSNVAIVQRTPATAPAVRSVAPPRYAGIVNRGARRVQGSGFFRVQQLDGAWWLVDPEGYLFFAVGTDHANYHVHWCEKLGYAPYHENMKRKHGSEEAWAKETVQRLKSWNFNTLAANHSPLMRYQGLPYIEQILGMGQGFASIDDLVKQTNWTGFPNVFSPRWKHWCEWTAYQRCAPRRNDPWLIGYFLDNELEWFGKDYRPWGLAIEALKRPAGHEARVALAQLLKEQYRGDVARFNRAWEANVSDFADIASAQQPPAIRTKAAEQDGIAFTRLCAELYFRTCAEAIRKYDPNHLILGCRFAGEAPPILDIAGKHCEVISINTYPRIDLRSGRVLNWEERLRHHHQQSKRPLMLTEWSFPAMDSGLPNRHGAGMRVDTQQQRAECFRIFQSALFRLPFMVGSSYFMWVDEPALGISSTFPEDSNYGLVNEQGEPYRELVQTATALQAKVYAMHAESSRYWQKSPQPSQKSIAFVRRTWRVPAGVHLAWQIDAFNRGNRAFTGWIGVDLSEHPTATRLSGSWECRSTDGKPVRFHVEPLHRRRVWVWVQGLPPGKAWSGLMTFTPSTQERPRHKPYVVSSDFRLSAPPFDLQFGNERAPVRSVSWLGQRAGSYTVLAQQSLSQMQWVPPNLHEEIQLVSTPFGYYLHGWLVHRDGSAITEVNQQTGEYAGQQSQPRSYRVEWDMEIRQDLPKRLLLVRMRRLQNLSKLPVRVEAVYHYAQSQLAGDGRDDEPAGVPNYYLNAGAWTDPQSPIFYGAMPLEAERWNCIFWKDPSGGQHPDLWQDVKREVKPQETIALEGGWAALLVGRGGFGKDDWILLTAQVQSLSDVVVSAQWIRRR